jgi:hypothetical protein
LSQFCANYLKTIRRFEMNMPGFDAESSLGPTMGIYRRKTVCGSFPSEGSGGGVMPQLGFQSDPDLGAYLRCRANGGGDLICRFFGGLPPFTIGGLLI